MRLEKNYQVKNPRPHKRGLGRVRMKDSHTNVSLPTNENGN